MINENTDQHFQPDIELAGEASYDDAGLQESADPKLEITEEDREYRVNQAKSTWEKMTPRSRVAVLLAGAATVSAVFMFGPERTSSESNDGISTSELMPERQPEELVAEEEESIINDTDSEQELSVRIANNQEEFLEVLERIVESDNHQLLDPNERIDSTGAIKSVSYRYDGSGLHKSVTLVDGSIHLFRLDEPGIKARNNSEVSVEIDQPDDDSPEEILQHLLEIEAKAFDRAAALEDDEYELRVLQYMDVDSLGDVVIERLNRIGNNTINSRLGDIYADEIVAIPARENEYSIAFDRYYGGEKSLRLRVVVRKGDDGYWRFADRILVVTNYQE